MPLQVAKNTTPQKKKKRKNLQRLQLDAGAIYSYMCTLFVEHIYFAMLSVFEQRTRTRETSGASNQPNCVYDGMVWYGMVKVCEGAPVAVSVIDGERKYTQKVQTKYARSITPSYN